MEYTYVSDHELVNQFINGNQVSLEILIDRHKDKVYTYILLMVKNHQLAEDLFQDTFMKVIKSLHKGKYRDDGKFIAWVIRIAHNLVIDHFRKEKQLSTVSDEDVSGRVFNRKELSDSTIEDDLIDNQISNDVRNLVEKLPEDQKQVILLRHYGGLSFKEIADQTNVSINTALGRMRYALIHLRRLIEEKNMTLTRS